ncbi:hypothetical protein TNCV_3149401 [Trichonephila clavipes]|nr:hypothetical protein TNCV_3149401 [Trichonephila clavipes]
MGNLSAYKMYLNRPRIDRNLNCGAEVPASFQNIRLRRKSVGLEFGVFQHEIRHISRSYGIFGKRFSNSGRPSRDAPGNSFSTSSCGVCAPPPPLCFRLNSTDCSIRQGFENFWKPIADSRFAAQGDLFRGAQASRVCPYPLFTTYKMYFLNP